MCMVPDLQIYLLPAGEAAPAQSSRIVALRPIALNRNTAAVALAAAMLVSLPMLLVLPPAADTFVEWKAKYGKEEIQRGYGGVRPGERSYEQETRRMFVGWKAKYGKAYRSRRR